MLRSLSFAALLALPLTIAAGTTAAAAADYCTFTSPASHVCSTKAVPATVRVTNNQVTVSHCIATSPASSACPATPVGIAGAAQPAAPMVASRN